MSGRFISATMHRVESERAIADRERLQMLNAVAAAIERRGEVLEASFDAPDRDEAVAAISRLLGVPARHAEAVVDLQFRRLSVEARRGMAKERREIRERLDG
jgi:DNA gyrase/topoisomerase IV subunit A